LHRVREQTTKKVLPNTILQTDKYAPMIRATVFVLTVLSFGLFAGSCAQDPIQEELILMKPDGFPDGFGSTEEVEPDGTVQLRQDGYEHSTEAEPDGTDQSRPDGYEPPNRRKKLPTPPPKL